MSYFWFTTTMILFILVIAMILVPEIPAAFHERIRKTVEKKDPQ